MKVCLNRLSAGSHWDVGKGPGPHGPVYVSIAFRLGPIGTNWRRRLLQAVEFVSIAFRLGPIGTERRMKVRQEKNVSIAFRLGPIGTLKRKDTR